MLIIGQCATCRHWLRHQKDTEYADTSWGDCNVGNDEQVVVLIETDDHYVGIRTHEMFGCVHHDEKS